MATVTFFEPAINALCDDLAVAYHVVNAPVIKRSLQAQCPVDTGLLRERHGYGALRPLGRRNYVIRFRASTHYSLVVHEGHGVIVPVRANVLRFVTKTGVVVFTKRVRAVAANPWMYRGLRLLGLPTIRTP